MSVLLNVVLAACGTSGSNPVEFPEVQFQVRPAGPTTFRVDALVGGGIGQRSVVGQEFTATSNFNFILENAAPPYSGIFTRTGGSEITVSLSFMSSTGATEVTDSTLGSKDSAVVMAGSTTGATATPVATSPEVRFDVCAPSPGVSTCFAPGDSGIFGIIFTGTAGDSVTSHVLGGTTPSIYFLDGARDTVNAVFTRQTITGDLLLAQLFIDGELRQTRADARDVVIREDL